MKLNKISKITGKIVLESGLHIGAGDTELRIGGTDNPVVKHPHTNEPYNSWLLPKGQGQVLAGDEKRPSGPGRGWKTP